MLDSLLDALPLPQRLALSYAPARVRGPTAALFALDARLAQAVRHQREPAVAQLRLAWWRDLFAQVPEMRPSGEPLVAHLAIWRQQDAALAALVDGWEHLISDQNLSIEAIRAFAQGRVEAFRGLERLVGTESGPDAVAVAARRWALGDLAAGLTSLIERDMVIKEARSLGSRPVSLPRELRPLAVLDGLARRVIARGGGAMFAGPGSIVQAFRIGIVGR